MIPLTGHYHAGLVLLSVVIAIFAAGAALDLAGRVTAARGRVRWVWLAGGATALGTGIWSMHYTGMLAFQLPVTVDYHEPTVVLSLLAAILASGIALFVSSRARLGGWRLLIGSTAMGAGIAAMHYVGMAAMRLPATLEWRTSLVVLSVVIAMVVSGVALRLAFRFGRASAASWSLQKVIAMLVMGLAIPIMHYTGMAAARFVPAPAPLARPQDIDVTSLGMVAIVATTMMLLLLAIVTSMVDRRITAERQDGVERQRKLIEELTAASERASESERRFRQLTENIPEVFYVFAADLTRVLYVSPAYERVWGRSVDLLHQNPQMFLQAVHPDDVGTLMESIGRVQRGETVETSYRVRLGDGTLRSILDRSVPVRDAGGVVYRIAGVARDVTEQQAAREAERLAHEEAERSASAKMAFLANMSHEIRTPMIGILGMAELLRDTPLAPDQHQTLDVITSSGDALLAILNDILDLSKIEAGELGLESIPFDLPALVHGTTRLFGARVAEKSLELVCDCDEALPQRVRGDPGRLRQVLTNLVGNAVKFTTRGEVELLVHVVQSESDRATVEFAVRDTGIGIAPEHANRIFAPFGQADTSTTRKYGGTGLGLSISRRLVRLMGSDISVESTLGSGSTFWFRMTFPIEAPATVSSVPLGSLQRLPTLVVDDNATNRKVLCGMLRHAGARVDEAASVEAALTALHTAQREGHPYRLVVSDVHMPNRDGFGLAEDVRNDPALRELRVMLLTSGGHPGDGDRCRRLGVAAYLHKPVARAELLEAAIGAVSSAPGVGEASPLITRHSIAEARRSLRILLAEDNEVNQQVAAAMLRKRGHVVTIVDDGQKAVDAVRTGAFDVVLMDIQMPVLGGVEATQEIRALPGGRSLPIVALTANALAGERERCLAAGMSEYLAKPFGAMQLFTMTERWSGGPASSDPEPKVAAPA